MGFTGREDPFFFCKPADAVLSVADGETGKMPYPPKTSNLHYEMELVVVLGKAAAIFRSSRPTTASGAMRWAWT